MGKGDGRRPERVAGSYRKGWDRIYKKKGHCGHCYDGKPTDYVNGDPESEACDFPCPKYLDDDLNGIPECQKCGGPVTIGTHIGMKLYCSTCGKEIET
jgi:hypothetical protein